MDNGLDKAPACSGQDIYLIEMREHRSTLDDPNEYDSVVVWAARSKDAALRWCAGEGPGLDDHDPDQWWWLAIYPQGVDAETSSNEILFLDWDGEVIDEQPLSGYKS